MIEELSAGAVVFVDMDSATRMYLTLHYPAGHWDFPKGAVEKGETEEQAARREIKEETGLSIESFVPSFRKKIDYHYRRANGLSHKQVIFFLARSVTDKVELSFEHSGYQWLPFQECLKRLSFENARNVLREANSFLLSKEEENGGSR